jgi:cytochrome c
MRPDACDSGRIAARLGKRPLSGEGSGCRAAASFYSPAPLLRAGYRMGVRILYRQRNRMEMSKQTLAVAALALAFGALPALAQDDLVAEGEKIFRRCSACHQVGPDAQNRVGPVLNGILGRTAGTLEDFNYSDAMVEAGENGLVWTEEELDIYLENPREKVPGTTMSFAGLRKEEDRAAVIAFLASHGSEGAAAEGEADAES